MTCFEWTRHDGSKVSISVGKLPGRKKPSVYIAESNEFCARVTPLASCVDEESARIIESFLIAIHEKKEPRP